MRFTTALDQVYEEIEIMKKMDHPNVIKLVEVIDDPSSDKLYLIMPLAEYGECMICEPAMGEYVPNQKL